jgi:hypothetical protein
MVIGLCCGSHNGGALAGHAWVAGRTSKDPSLMLYTRDCRKSSLAYLGYTKDVLRQYRKRVSGIQKTSEGLQKIKQQIRY